MGAAAIEHGWPRHEYSKHSTAQSGRHNLHATTNQWRHSGPVVDQNRADLILGLGGTRDTQQGLQCGQEYKENQNILNPKFLTNWPRSVEREDICS